MPEQQSYTQQLYNQLSTIDPTYSKDVPFDKFQTSIKDKGYATQVYNQLNSVDPTYGKDVPFSKFYSSVNTPAPNTNGYQWSTQPGPQGPALAEGHEQDIVDYVHQQEATYKKINNALSTNKAEVQPEKPAAQVLSEGEKALSLGTYLDKGGYLGSTPQATIETKNIMGIPTPFVKDGHNFDPDNGDPHNNPVAAVDAKGQAANIFANPDQFSKEDIMQAGGKAETAMKNTLAKLQADRNELQAIQKHLAQGEGYHNDEAHQNLDLNQVPNLKLFTRTEGKVNVPEEISKLNQKIEYLSNNLSNLRQGTSKLIATTKAFPFDFSNPDVVKEFTSMPTQDLMNTAIKEQAAVTNATNIGKYVDEISRATTLDPEKAQKSKDFMSFLNDNPTLKNSPVAIKLGGTDPDDMYQMNSLHRMELGYGGMNGILEKLGEAQKKDVEALSQFNDQLTQAKVDYTNGPTPDGLKKVNALVDARNNFIKSNLGPKEDLYKRLDQTINDQFVGLKVHDYLQKKVDDLNNTLLGAINYSTIGTVQDVVYNEAILGTYALLKRTDARGLAANGRITPEQEASRSNALEEDIAALKMPTPTVWQKYQSFQWDKDGFKVHPAIALHSMVKMTSEMGGFILGSLGGEELAGGAAFLGGYEAGGISGLASRIGGMSAVTAAMFGNEMISGEEAKGLPAAEAYKIAMMRILLQSTLQEAIFSPAQLLKGAPISKEMTQMAPEEAFKQVSASYKKIFGKDLTPETYKYLFNTKEFLKDASHPMIAQSAIAVANDIGDHLIDKYVHNNINPEYEVKDISAKSELLNIMNTMASMIPTGIEEGVKGYYGKINNSIATARYLVAREADLHYANIKDQLDKGEITPEVAAAKTKMVADLKDVHDLTAPIFSAIDGTEWSEVDKDRKKIEAFNNTLNIRGISEEIAKNPESEEIEKLNKFLTDKAEKEVEINKETKEATNPSPEDLEKERVTRESDYLKNEFSDVAIATKTDKDKIEKELQGLWENVQTEKNPSLKKLYEEKMDQLQIHLSALTTVASDDRPVEAPKELEPKESLAQYAKDELGFKQVEIDDMTHQNLQDIVDSHREMVSGQTAKEVDMQVAKAKSSGTPEEQSEALHSLFLKLSEDPAKADLAAKVHEEYEAVENQIKESKDKAAQVQFQGRTFTTGNYVKVGDEYYKVSHIDNSGPDPILIVAPKNDSYFLKVRDVSKLGEELTPNEIATKFNQQFGKDIPTQQEAEESLGEKPETKKEEAKSQAPVNTPESKEQAKTEDAAKKFPVNPMRTIREDNPNESTYKTWTSTISKIAKEVPEGDFLKKGYSVIIMNSKDIPIEHMSGDYSDYVKTKLGGDRSKDTGKHAVIADEKGEPIKFGANGDKDERGTWAISEIPTVYDKGLAKRLHPTEEQLSAVGKTKVWFDEQLAKLRVLRDTKISEGGKEQYTISRVSEGVSVQDYTKPKPVEKSTGGQKLTIHISEGKAINGYPTDRGVLYGVVDGQKEPIRLEKPAFSKSDIDAIINLSKKTVPNSMLAGLPDDIRKSLESSRARMEYLRKLVYSGLNADIDFHFGSDHGVYEVKNGRVEKLLSDEEIRSILQDKGFNADSKTLRQDPKFDFIGWDGEKFTASPYDKYSDFLKDKFSTYTESTAPESKTAQHIEIGDKITSLAGGIDKAATEEKPIEVPIKEEVPKIETKPENKPGDNIVKDSPVQETGRKRRAKIDNVKPTDLGEGLKDETGELKRDKRLLNNTTAEEDRIAKIWFENSPLSKHINFKDFRAIINSDAWATWSKSAVTLWNGGKYSDLYHEAWHEFSQLYLTKEQKRGLYDEVAKTSEGKKAIEGKETQLEKDKALEELVAEDFRKYILSGAKEVLGNRPTRNNIFKRIYEKLKELFTGRVSLQTYYDRLYKGDINKYQRNEDNAMFGNLTKGISGVVRDDPNGQGRIVSLDNRQTRSLYKRLDGLIGSAFARAEKPITMMFEKNNVLNKVYNDINSYLQNDYNATVDKIDGLYERLDNAKDESEIASIELELQHYNGLADNLQFTIQNWETVVKNHKEYSPFMNISKDRVVFDEKGEIVDSEGDEEVDSENSRDASVIKNENGASSKEAASNETIYLVATLPKFHNGEPVANEFLPNGQDTVDFANTWNTLSHELAGVFDYDQMISKIKGLGGSKPEFLELADRLPDPNKTEPLSASELRLRNAFINDLSKPIVLVKEVLAVKTGPRLQFFYSKAAPTSLDVLKGGYSDNFQSLQPENHNGLIGRDQESGNIHLIVPAITKNYYNTFVDTKGTDPLSLRNSKLEFLELLGYSFSGDTLNDPDFQRVLDDKKGAVFQLYSGLKYLNEAYSSMGKLISNPIADLGRDQWVNGKLISRGQRKNINDLVEFELKHSDSFFTENATNANGDTVWQKQDRNYITNIYSNFNDAQKYPKYQDILEQPHLQQFDIHKNAFMNGIFLNSMFKLDVPQTDPSYGTRRTVRVNGQDVFVQISLDNYNGLRIDAKEQQGVANEGKTTTELTAFEKFVQNFNSLLVAGIAEHMRYGDKSSAYATTLNGLYDPSTGRVDPRKLIVPIDDFHSAEWSSKVNQEGQGVDYMPDRLFSVLKMYLRDDILPMKSLKLEGIGKNWFHFRENGKDFGVMEDFLSKETKDKLLGSDIFKNKDADVWKEIGKFDKEIREDFRKYIISQTREVKSLFSGVEDVLKSGTLIDQKLLSEHSFGQLVTAYASNQILSHIEHLKSVANDPRFSKAKGGKRDLFKRLSQFSATGNYMVVDAQTNSTIEANHPRLMRQALIDRDKADIPLKAEDGHINSIINKDIEYSSDRLLDVYKKHLIDRFGLTPEEAENETVKYKEINEGDGQGQTTLDEYKQSKLRSGSSHWTAAHEAAYQKEAAFLRGEGSGISTAESALFVPQKWQYSGTALDNNGYAIPVFYKFSVAPLIPSMIKGTPFEQIHNNMIKQNVGLSLFNSGSKHSAVVDDKGQFNPFYSDYAARTPYEGKYTINKIFYNYLKEQVNIDPKSKENVTFSTQMRKLLQLNLFTHGVPDDFKGSRDTWDKMSNADKLKNSGNYKLEQDFGKLVDDLLSIERSAVLRKMGAKLEGDKYSLDVTKLSTYLQEEFVKRGLPDEAIDFMQTNGEGQFKYPLDASTQRDKIEKIAMSIANRKLVRQKINGDALIQMASSGYELNQSRLKNPTEADLKKWGEGSDLPFYLPDGRKLADGSTVTSAMKVKVALTDRWNPLLRLSHTDGKEIGTIDRLNESIKDDAWLDKDQNRKMISMVGVRIPVQGLNSHEFMEVYHFVPREAGNIIIVSPQIVAKSGGDFDIDKLTTYMPNLRIGEDEKPDMFKRLSDDETGQLYDRLSKAYNDLTKSSDRIEDGQLVSKPVDVTKGGKKAANDLISSIFGTNVADLDKELVKDLFGTDKKMGREQFVDWYKKKSIENALIDNVRGTLEKGDNFRQLIRPNDTDLLKPYADMLRGDKAGSWTKLVEPLENLRQFSSNLVGKSNLGIAAVNNTLFALLQRSGMYLNPTYKITKASGKQVEMPTRINMPHNEVTVDGKTFISVSGQYDAEKKHLISDVISQFINGFVDVAKDDWVFYINGVREMVPTMLYATMAGVNNKTMLGFFNQPAMKEFVTEFQKGRSLFMRLQDVSSYNFAKRKAQESLFFNTPVGDGVAQGKIDAVKALYKKADESVENIRNIERKLDRETNAEKQHELFLDLEAARNAQTQASINKAVGFNELLATFKEYAAKDKELFSGDKLFESAFGDKKLDRFDQLKVFAHFLELQEQSGLLTSLQTTLNADTRKASSSFFVGNRMEKRKDALGSGLFPEHVVDRITNESTVRAFLNSDTGFDKFTSQLYNQLFEVTNHPTFNTELRKIMNSPAYGVPFEKRGAQAEEFQRVFKNDFIQYLNQNYVYEHGSYNLVSDLTKPLFSAKGGLADQLRDIRVKYPDLVGQFPFLDLLGADKARKVDIKNLKFRSAIYDSDELNSITQQIRTMSKFSDPSYSPEELREIQEFAKKFTNFAFMQSGLNRSPYYMTDVIPNESYSPGITPAILKFRELLDKNPMQALKEIKAFSNKFKINNPRFFDTKQDDTPFNYDSFRKKDYKLSNSYDLLGKKGEAKQAANQAYVDKLPGKVQEADNTRNSAFMKKNPKSLMVIEDNKVGPVRAQLTKAGVENWSDLITKEKASAPLKDENLKDNVALLENGIQAIIEKSKGYDNIVLPKDGIGMHLKDAAPLTYDYLSNRLYELFGFKNPGFEPITEPAIVRKDSYQIALDKAKDSVFTEFLADNKPAYLDLPLDYKGDLKTDMEEIDMYEKYGKDLTSMDDWKKAQEVAKRVSGSVLLDWNGEPTTFEDMYKRGSEIWINAGFEKPDKTYDNVEQLLDEWRQDRIPIELRDAAEEFLKEHGLIQYKTYDPNQLSLFRDEDFEAKGCDKPCS